MAAEWSKAELGRGSVLYGIQGTCPIWFLLRIGRSADGIGGVIDHTRPIGERGSDALKSVTTVTSRAYDDE
jgi:hypothetical protein